jgi:ketosteroid isomerase-like protein
MNMVSGSKHQTGIGATEAADVIDVDALMQANVVRVFNERNSDRRRAALAELYAEDATLYDPEAVATGRDAISGAVAQLLRTLPSDFVFTAPGMLWATTVPHDSFGG